MRLFGFEILRGDSGREAAVSPSFIPKTEDDGAVAIAPIGNYGTYLDLDGSVRSDAELITKYREMSGVAEIENAIDDIVNEAIVINEDDKPITIDLDDTRFDPKIKEIIRAEFEWILSMMNFNMQGYDLFRRWYIDGRIYFHAVIDKKQPQLGIKELRYIDPRKIRKIRQANQPVLDRSTNTVLYNGDTEYYIFNPKGFNKDVSQTTAAGWENSAEGLKIAKDSIIYVTSGLLDKNQKVVLSYLQKAIKPLNQLRALEDSVVIYRLSRAPERRIFYIDVGNLPKAKAEQYLNEIQTNYKNKLVYDAATGEIRDDRKFMTMMEDFWLARREGGRGTEISTLPAGQNLGEMSDVNYFLTKLYRALSVPVTRVLQEQSAFPMGVNSVITRDEVKFGKFITRLRSRFSKVFADALEKQLILKQIITIEEWDYNKNNIKYKYARDVYLSELKDAEIYKNRMETLRNIEPYIGRFFSERWIQETILKMTEEDANDMRAQMDAEMQINLQRQAQMLQMQLKLGLIPPEDQTNK